MNLSEVAGYAAAAGFTGEALVTIVAIVERESGGNPDAVGDVALEDATWGPSVGLYQIRTLKAETGTGGDRDIAALMPMGKGDPARQSAAAFTISGGGSNFTPWTTYSALPAATLDRAYLAVENGVDPPAAARAVSSGSGSFLGDALVGPMDSALAAFLGLPKGQTVAEWMAEISVRGLELVGGAALFAVGALMFIDVLMSGSGAPSVIRQVVDTGRTIATGAAKLAAA